MTTTPIKRSVAIAAIAASTLGGVASGAAFFTPVIAGAQDDVVEAEQAAPGHGEQSAKPSRFPSTTEPSPSATTPSSRPSRTPAPTVASSSASASAVRVAPARSPRSSASRAARCERRSGTARRSPNWPRQGIDSADIVDAIVTRAEERLDTAVENGRIDDTQAAEMLTQAAERAEDLVNGEIEFGGRRGHHGFGGPAGDAGVDAEASA